MSSRTPTATVASALWLSTTTAMATRTEPSTSPPPLPIRDRASLRQRRLAEGLGISGDRGAIVAWRDSLTGLEYLRRASDLLDRGLTLDLHAYQSHVFLDWRELRPTAEQPWDRLMRLAQRARRSQSRRRTGQSRASARPRCASSAPRSRQGAAPRRPRGASSGHCPRGRQKTRAPAESVPERCMGVLRSVSARCPGCLPERVCVQADQAPGSEPAEPASPCGRFQPASARRHALASSRGAFPGSVDRGRTPRVAQSQSAIHGHGHVGPGPRLVRAGIARRVRSIRLSPSARLSISSIACVFASPLPMPLPHLASRAKKHGALRPASRFCCSPALAWARRKRPRLLSDFDSVSAQVSILRPGK